MIDFPIERINQFFANHIFEVYLQPTHDEDYSIPTNVKVKLTGVKGYISIGDKKPHVEYTLYIFFRQMKLQTYGVICMGTFMVEMHQLIRPVKNMQILDG